LLLPAAEFKRCRLRFSIRGVSASSRIDATAEGLLIGVAITLFFAAFAGLNIVIDEDLDSRYGSDVIGVAGTATASEFELSVVLSSRELVSSVSKNTWSSVVGLSGDI